jgi:MoaA/NifB/PqqE/SkfB family radical SAM enzyme
MSDKFGRGYLKRGINNQWITLGRLMIGRSVSGVLEATPVRPVYSSIMVTQNCNYKCVMCSFWYSKTANELTLDELLGVLRDLRQLGIAQVNFTGGEPLLRDDLREIVAGAASHDFRMIQITTNGSLATRERLTELVEAGARRFAISCDGVGEHHETQRGVPGAWKKNITALDALRDLRATKYPGLEIELPIVLSKTTVGDLKDMLRLCDEYGAVVHVQFLDNVQYFTAPADLASSALSAEEVDRVVEEIHGYIDTARGIDPLLTHEGIEYVRYHMKREERPDAPKVSCGVGYAMVYIDSLGNVFPGCFAVAPVGNLRETPLTEIVGSAKHCQVAQDLLRMNCPHCPGGYAWGVFMNPRALAREGVGRVKRRLGLLGRP